MEYIAHIREDGQIQTVKEHLKNTAELAGCFAAAFEAEEAGRAAGLLHDIGKYSREFQRRIQGGTLRVDHSTAGAQISFKQRLLPVAFAVAGHHAGIPDGGSRMDTKDEPTLMGRLKRSVPNYDVWEQEIDLPAQILPDWVKSCKDAFTQSFFTRMLFSCLVDADYLDTETFMQGEQPRGGYETICRLLQKLNKKTDAWLEAEETDNLKRSRNAILRACIKAGRENPQGLYTLTVPTGGGKTISSLAFALEHAAANELERVIYVIPYTSIIDQTVGEFREILGEENVLAHYAQAEFQLADREDLSTEDYRRALAAENWDAPVIVTTAVQFFESLYANRSAKCRKLHNLAKSVIIFDEAQTLPIPYLLPCIAAIAQLVKYYHTTAVLCTATQPKLDPLFADYGLHAKEICPDGEQLYTDLQRTVIRDIGTISKEGLGERLAAHTQALCVVNRRKDAQELYEALPEEGSYCLTTLLCAADRKVKFEEIRSRLKEGRPCRVVSTSLIEAGVDVDFPVAYREEAGLDSLLQTAGRCNREGKEPDPEHCPVYLFRLEDTKTLSELKQQTAALRFAQERSKELHHPDAIEQYFDMLLYKMKDREALDQHGILSAFKKGKNGKIMPFAETAKEFSLIQNASRTVYIPADEHGVQLCDRLRAGAQSRSLMRQLGPYSVSVYEAQWNSLYLAGALEPLDSYTAVLLDMNQYDAETGLKSDVSGGQALFS